jgi:hypothetical protein
MRQLGITWLAQTNMRYTERNMEPDFYLIPSIVKKQKGLRPSDWFVYATIYWYEHMAGNKCFASNAAIARASGMGERTVGLALEHLEKCGFIEREFIDRGKTRRSQIHARVFFSQTPSLFGEGSTSVPPTKRVAQVCHPGGTGVPQSINIEKVIKPIAATSAAPVKIFNSEEKKKAWYDGDDEAFQLLAWFFDKKGIWKRFDSEAKLKAAVARHIRSARKLVKGDWSQKELNNALTRMLEANPKMREEWTLDTLEKYLTK